MGLACADRLPHLGKDAVNTCLEEIECQDDRDASAANHAFDEAARGDLIQLEGLAEKGDGLRLAREGAATLPGADALAARASAASDAPGDSARPDAGEGRGGEQ